MTAKKRFDNRTDFLIEPPVNLLPKVLSRIDRERQLTSTKRKLWTISGVFLAGMLLALPVFNIFAQQLVGSGFARYFSLLFSDLRYLINDWQDFAFSLLETLPALATALVLLVIFILTLSANYIVKYLKIIRRLSKPNTAAFKH